MQADEFDTSDLTDRVGKLQKDLEMADQVNGKLIRLMKNVLIAWHGLVEKPQASELAAVMVELEEAFHAEEARRR